MRQIICSIDITDNTFCMDKIYERGGNDAGRTNRDDECHVGAMVVGKLGRQYMDVNQKISIGNAIVRIICGDSRSYYVGRPVEEINPLIKAIIDWSGKQGWSKEQIQQYFGDQFMAYYSGILGIRYKCASLWLRRAFNQEDADSLDFTVRSFIEKSGLIPEGTSHVFAAMVQTFPSEEFEALFVRQNSAREIMNRCDADLEVLSKYHPLPEMRNFFISRLQGEFEMLNALPVFRKEGCWFWIGVAGIVGVILYLIV